MKDTELSGPKTSHHDASSGLTSANDMSDSCPAKGWGGQEEISGVDNPGGSPMRTAADQGMGFGGPTGGAPISTGMDGDDVDVPMTMVMDLGESPGPLTGGGLRSAVGESPKS